MPETRIPLYLATQDSEYQNKDIKENVKKYSTFHNSPNTKLEKVRDVEQPIAESFFNPA